VAALLRSYERWGYFDEVLSLLEAALSLERAHVRVFTSGIISSDYLDRWVSLPNCRSYTASTDLANVGI
jgi:hypothetical protein